jgi:hypothetical protein
MFLGLVRDPEWQPPDGFPEPSPDRPWEVPWRALAWLAGLGTMLKLEPVVEHEAGAVVGYGFLLATVALGAWRLDRWCSRLYWRGLRDYQS